MKVYRGEEVELHSNLSIRTPNHTASGIDIILTMLHRFPNFNLRTGCECPTLALLPLERNPVPIVQETGWA
jgi:hypothetical protein